MSPATLGKWICGLALGLALSGACVQADAAPPFQILSAHTYRQNMVYYLDADARSKLDEQLRNALLNGVSVMLVYDVRVLHPGAWWWFDDTVASLRQSYRLRYYPLSRRYLVDNLNTGISRSYAQLSDALAMVDRLRRFPVLDQSLVPKHERVVADVRIRVDTSDFPLPLRVRAFVDSGWRPASDWYRCSLH